MSTTNSPTWVNVTADITAEKIAATWYPTFERYGLVLGQGGVMHLDQAAAERIHAELGRVLFTRAGADPRAQLQFFANELATVGWTDAALTLRAAMVALLPAGGDR